MIFMPVGFRLIGAHLGSAYRLPTSIRGRAHFFPGGHLENQRLPTDSVGTANITFSGVNAGSEIRVFLADGTEVAGIESCAANQVLSWPAYTVGSLNNNVTIRIVANAYKIIELPYVTAEGTTSIPVQQQIDPWYRNPA